MGQVIVLQGANIHNETVVFNATDYRWDMAPQSRLSSLCSSRGVEPEADLWTEEVMDHPPVTAAR